MKTVKTIWGSMIDNMKLFNSNVSFPFNVTLNEKYGITGTNSDAADFELGFYSIGMRPDIVPNGFTHDSSDREVYKPIPFLIVKKSTGLTPAQEDSYRIKTDKLIDGVNYTLCYLKKVSSKDFDSTAFNITYNSDNKLFTLDELSVNDTYVKPMVPDECNNGLDNSFYGVSAKVSASLSLSEVDTLKANARLLYGVNTPALFEIGLYGAIDDLKSKELSNTTAYLFKSIDLIDYTDTGGIDIVINIGGMTAM